MNKKYVLSSMVVMCTITMSFCHEPQAYVAAQVTSQQHQKMKLLVGVIEPVSSTLREMLPFIKKDLEFSGQFDVTVKGVAQLHTKNDIAQLFGQGYSLALFLNDSVSDDGIDWRVYDTTQVTMLKGSKYVKRGTLLRGWAHNIADSLWPVLTGDEGFFSTKIAYAQDVRSPKKRKVKHIFVADYDGSHEQELVSVPTVSVAPRWNNDKKSPLLFYSEYTNKNVRLVAVNMQKKRKIASNFDGVNMLPAFSQDGKNVVYCASHGAGNCQLHYYHKGSFKQITHNAGNNVSPTFSDDGKKIYFCSDYQTGKPQLYSYDVVSDNMIRLTHGGYCASPSYSPQRQKLAYSKIVNGVMQLFMYDTVTQEHVQMTFDKGNKEEYSWSPCGKFLLFSVEEGQKSRIALLNTITNERRYLTSDKQVCSYPTWSPVYEEFPIVG